MSIAAGCESATCGGEFGLYSGGVGSPIWVLTVSVRGSEEVGDTVCKVGRSDIVESRPAGHGGGDGRSE